MKTKTNIKAGIGSVRRHGNHSQALMGSGITARTALKAGGRKFNHNETIVRPGMKIKTSVKAGGRIWNHNQTLVGSGLRTQTQVKAGIGGVRRRRATGG